ncbi:hypothetical protein [Limosilactobacillus fermentum]|uniref:hypothetical protein n=1 Tax=Limosilactobacillus fermentum TaxID=1613 RepID=UPI002F26D4DA
MMDRIYKTTITGFGLNVWPYNTKSDEVNGFISDWESTDDPIDVIDRIMWDDYALACEPFTSSDAVYLYFTDDVIKRRNYSPKEMQEIIRDTFIRALWFVYQENEHSESLNQSKFKEKCVAVMGLESLGHKLNEHIEELF